VETETKQPPLGSVLAAIGELDPQTAWFAVDADQTITWWSPGAERLLGFRAEDVVGKHCSHAIHCVRCGKGCGLRDVGKIRDATIDHFDSEGREVPTLKRAHAIRDGAGRFLGGVEMLRPGEHRAPQPPRSGPVELHGIQTRDPAFIAFLSSLRSVAHADVNVLIRGETGSGKELVARAIHAMSKRAGKPFVAVNCGTLSRELLASEIFGHRRGAFTGAVADKKGLLAMAEGGSLLLDEVAEMPVDVQSMLLRVVQERRYRPLGDTRDLAADVRLISATHRSLRQAVADGRFREDLMYRLRVVPLFLPPLRDRPVDIGLLWENALEHASTQYGLAQPTVTPELMDILQRHPWPGNVRELINLAEYVTVTRAGQEVAPEHLLPEFLEEQGEGPGGPPPKPRKPRRGVNLTREEIETALDRAGGSTEDAATTLGVSRITLWRRRKKLGMV